ncbi:MAG: sigma-70 family RNA polymerase sigma factor [Cyanobacteria bacterium CAN_BIN43]|nr:sigma-70 family RNA polymerase sigma factor [Cyanobacteria bacterium CAN_BIN43]
MRARQNLLEMFSTFLQFEADRFSGWATDLKLRRSMNRCPTQSSEPSEQYWVIYWYKRWQSSPTELERGHLAAYLQEVCYWEAQQTMQRFRITQYTMSDCFQVAIARIDKILRSFNLDYGSNLKAYASTAFGGLIREFLRQRQVVDICSDWALLRKLSQKRLVAALQAAAIRPQLLPSYVLAWQCLKTFNVPTQATSTHKLPKPNEEIWQQVTQLYNGERLSQLSSPGSEATPEALEKWMQQCVKAARAYLHPVTTSINAPKAGHESGELLDTLMDDRQDSLLTTLIDQEDQQSRQTQHSAVDQVLSSALSTLEPQVQQMLSLYYGQQLSQQEITKQLNVKQYTISRRFSKARELLLMALAKWSQETLHITPTLDVLNGISNVLEEWLTTHYHPDFLAYKE